MSDGHKAALAKGREEGFAVRRYLEGLESSRPKRGRKRTPDSLKKKLADIASKLDDADPLTRLHLLQTRSEIELELAKGGEVVDLSELEKGFIKVARSYSERKGITYSTWREAGVSPTVLQKAGIPRTRG